MHTHMHKHLRRAVAANDVETLVAGDLAVLQILETLKVLRDFALCALDDKRCSRTNCSRTTLDRKVWLPLARL